MRKRDDTSGDETYSVDSLREYLTVEHDLSSPEVSDLLAKYSKRLEVASRFGDRTRDVAREIMRAEGK